ncbi:zincin [Gonapodya prolifera JEL478]|uniref:Zincin n=1 Tax=Gonapodya prolifera (strain JEL478) TaxID=1344416 RepID=A0A139AFW4_GONPJ|nr:zincin [Gonapodya prolifera JEL478]|eukprot:KXS15650.1 zincin [Gonapodya prolifera JEL478]
MNTPGSLATADCSAKASRAGAVISALPLPDFEEDEGRETVRHNEDVEAWVEVFRMRRSAVGRRRAGGSLSSATPVSLGVLGVEVNLGGNGAGGSRENCAQLCTTKECVVESAAIVSSLNTAVSPCDDFFEFACGGWLKSHPIPESKYSVNQFDALEDKNKSILKSIFESPYTNTVQHSTNDSAMEAVGAAPLLEFSAELDKQWPNLGTVAGFAPRAGIRGLVTVGASHGDPG